MRPLSEKEMAFAAGVVSGKSGTQAAKDAGYAPGAAHVAAARLLRKVPVAAEIERLRALVVAKVEDETGVTLKRLIEELSHTAFLDPVDFYGPDGRVLPITQMPERARRALAHFDAEDKFDASSSVGNDDAADILIKFRTSKIKPNDKKAAIELIARLLGLLKDKVDVEAKGGFVLRWADE